MRRSVVVNCTSVILQYTVLEPALNVSLCLALRSAALVWSEEKVTFFVSQAWPHGIRGKWQLLIFDKNTYLLPRNQKKPLAMKNPSLSPFTVELEIMRIWSLHLQASFIRCFVWTARPLHAKRKGLSGLFCTSSKRLLTEVTASESKWTYGIFIVRCTICYRTVNVCVWRRR